MADPAAQTDPSSEDRPRADSQPSTSLSLLERARANDAEAWRQLVQLYRPLVLFWSTRGGVGATDAEDVAQEVFTAAALGLARFRRDRPGDTFRGWLHGITRNHILLHRRRNGSLPQAEGGSGAWDRLQQVADPTPTADPEEAFEIGQVYRRAVELVRCEFNAHTWQAFWLAVVEGRSTDAVAAELTMTTAGVRQARSRILRRLKQEVGDLLE